MVCINLRAGEQQLNQLVTDSPELADAPEVQDRREFYSKLLQQENCPEVLADVDAIDTAGRPDTQLTLSNIASYRPELVDIAANNNTQVRLVRDWDAVERALRGQGYQFQRNPGHQALTISSFSAEGKMENLMLLDVSLTGDTVEMQKVVNHELRHIEANSAGNVSELSNAQRESEAYVATAEDLTSYVEEELVPEIRTLFETGADKSEIQGAFQITNRFIGAIADQLDVGSTHFSQLENFADYETRAAEVMKRLEEATAPFRR